MSSEPDRRTIEDFGSQWRRYPESRGFYASVELLRDICEPLLDVAELRDAVVLEIGSGAGRIVRMLLDSGVERVLAVEPSAAIEVLRRNTAADAARIEYLEVPGDQIPARIVDFVLSIGVLHHIPDPAPVVRRAFELLRPGGRMLFWVYGREGNEAYLRVALPLRRLTRLLPDGALGALSHLLNALLTPYVALCRRLPLPMHRYLREVLGRFDWRTRSLVIFDQLNPRFARYYEEAEARDLMASAGFTDVRLHHRHGYSWTVVGRRAA
jgi:SAM-dependent methyltransferase